MNETVSGGFTSLFGEAAPATQQVAPPAAAPVPQPAQQPGPAAPAAPVAAAQPPAQPTAQEVPAAPQGEDPEFLKLFAPQQTQQVQWSEEAKSAFKATYGQEDPIAFKQQYDTVTTELQLLRQKNEQNEGATRLLDTIEQKYPALAAAIAKATENKDPFEYLSSLPNPSILGKASKDLSDHFLLETYQRDRFSQDELNALKSGDYTDLPISKEDLQAKVKAMLPVAQYMHDERNQKHVASLQQQEQQARQMREAVDKSITEAIAQANNDPAVARHIDRELIEKVRKGTFLNGVVFNEDGTWSKSAVSNFIKGQRYDVDIKRAYEAGRAAAGQRNSLVEMASAPERFAPNTGGPAAPQQQKPADNNGTFYGIGDFMSNTAVPQRN